MLQSITVHELYLYPVKSAKGFSVKGSSVDQFGLKLDRRWMVIDEKNCFVTQRECPKMSTLEAKLGNSFLELSVKGVGDIGVPLSNFSGKELLVQVWNDKVRAKDCGKEVAHFLKKALGSDYRLVFMDLPDRKVEGFERIVFPFSDSSPFLVISRESLDDLNRRLEKPLLIDRFRPNIVTKGALPYGEDFWEEYKIGNIVFKKLKDCTRCQVTTVDQVKGVFDGKEPLKTLAQYRLRNNKVCFGQNAYHLEEGQINVGDPIQILKESPHSRV